MESTNKPTIPVMDAIVLLRLFAKVERQISVAWQEGRSEDACGMARMIGTLRVRIAGSYSFTPLDECYDEVAA